MTTRIPGTLTQNERWMLALGTAELGGGAVLLALWLWKRGCRGVLPPERVLALALGCERSNVSKRKADLQAAGLVEFVRKDGELTYVLTMARAQVSLAAEEAAKEVVGS